MNIHPEVLAAHSEFGGDLESMQRAYEWYDLKSEVDSLKVQVSQYAYERDLARRERDGYYDKLSTAIYRLCVVEDTMAVNDAQKSLVKEWIKDLRDDDFEKRHLLRSVFEGEVG